MVSFEPGDSVLIDITDTTDPDFQWHGADGTIVGVLEDDTEEVTETDPDGSLYRVRLEDYDQSLVLRHRDLRPPLDG